MRSLLVPALFLFLPAIAFANISGDPVKGKAIYTQRCAACHSIEFNGAGPSHRGLLGRKAGTVANYSYSAALKSSKVVWSSKTLDKWLANPQKFIPGQKMGVAVSDAIERQDIIAYLQTETNK
jgi:cytochrome c